MALSKCGAVITDNIKLDCTNPPLAGFDDVALLIDNADIDTITRDATNPRKITAITMLTDKKPIAVYNPVTNPFSDSGVEASFDGALPTFTKSANVYVPNIGGEASEKVLEPLIKNRSGFTLILARKNKVADGAYLIMGSERGMIATAGSQNLTDNDTNGMLMITLTEEAAQFGEVTLTGATFAAAKATFDGLLALVP